MYETGMPVCVYWLNELLQLLKWTKIQIYTSKEATTEQFLQNIVKIWEKVFFFSYWLWIDFDICLLDHCYSLGSRKWARMRFCYCIWHGMLLGQCMELAESLKPSHYSIRHTFIISSSVHTYIVLGLHCSWVCPGKSIIKNAIVLFVEAQNCE